MITTVYPTSQPSKKSEIDNYMTITTGRTVILEIDWVVWMWVWKVVVADAGTFLLSSYYSALRRYSIEIIGEAMIHVIAISTDKTKEAHWKPVFTIDTVQRALSVFFLYKEISQSLPEIQQVAIFKYRGAQTYEYRPSHLYDRRDKRSWPILGVGGLINSRDASFF